MKKIMVESLNALFEALNDDNEAVFWISAPGYTTNLYISSNYQNIWGRSPQHLYECALDFYSTLHPDDAEITHQKCIDNSNDPSSHDILFYRVLQPSGEMKYIKDHHFVIVDSSDKVIGFSGIARIIPAKIWEIERERSELSLAINQYDLISKFVFDNLRSRTQQNNIQAQDSNSSKPHVIALSDNKVISLTTKENEVLKLLLQGKSAKQSAAILNVSPRTVEFHIDNIKTKANCRNKLELISKIIQQRNEQG